MSRRTETAYKAKFPGELAQHNEAQRFRRYGKCCGCVAKVHVLIRGDLPEVAFVLAMEVGLRPILKRMEQPPNPKAEKKAHQMATFDVIRQKSAEAILAQCPE